MAFPPSSWAGIAPEFRKSLVFPFLPRGCPKALPLSFETSLYSQSPSGLESGILDPRPPTTLLGKGKLDGPDAVVGQLGIQAEIYRLPVWR